MLPRLGVVRPGASPASSAPPGPDVTIGGRLSRSHLRLPVARPCRAAARRSAAAGRLADAAARVRRAILELRHRRRLGSVCSARSVATGCGGRPWHAAPAAARGRRGWRRRERAPAAARANGGGGGSRARERLRPRRAERLRRRAERRAAASASSAPPSPIRSSVVFTARATVPKLARDGDRRRAASSSPRASACASRASRLSGRCASSRMSTKPMISASSSPPPIGASCIHGSVFGSVCKQLRREIAAKVTAGARGTMSA